MTHTTQVLSDEQIEEIDNAHNWQTTAGRAAAYRAIESATLKSVSGQEPVGEIAAFLPDGVGLHVSWLAHSGQKLCIGDKLFALPPAQPAPVDERETREQKHERNWRVQSRYNELMRDGERGQYEAMFRVVQEEVEAARAALQCAQAPQAGGWQPIETAPKDGQCLLWVDTDDGGEVMKLQRNANGDWLYEGEPTYCHGFYIKPTHWQPLPPAPQPTKGQQ